MFISLDGKLYERYCETMVGGNHIPASELFQLDPSKFIKVQFTGLLDKNGKEIYEADIVEWSQLNYVCRGFVVYHQEYCRFSVAWPSDLHSYLKDGFHGTFRNMKSTYHEGALIVIGNIFETPELLEKK